MQPVNVKLVVATLLAVLAHAPPSEGQTLCPPPVSIVNVPTAGNCVYDIALHH